MKFIITLFYLLFLSNIALAETSSDYAMGKKGTMDFEIKCTNENGQSSIHGFKKINDKLSFTYLKMKKIFRFSKFHCKAT